MTTSFTGSLTAVNGFRYWRSASGSNGRLTENPYRLRKHWSYLGSNPLNEIYSISGGVKSSQPNYGYTPISDPLEMALWDNNDEIKLIGKLVSRVKGHDFNPSSAFAEVEKTLGSVKQSANAVFSAAREASRGNIPGAARSLATALQGMQGNGSRVNRLNRTDISGTWLSIQYGWKPLLSDIHEAMKALEVLAGPPRTADFRVSLVRKTQRDWRKTSSYPPFLFNVVQRKELRVKAVEQISKERTFLGMDPLTIIWERVPFSFVFDWFIPVGEFLQTLGEVQQMVYGNVYYTYSMDARGRCKVDTNCGKSNYQPHTYYCTSGSGSERTYHTCGNVSQYHYYRLDRGGQTLSVPAPSLNTLERAFSLGHLRNAAALINSGIQSKPDFVFTKGQKR